MKKYPTTREALLKELAKEKEAEEKARVPGMCSFVLANYMGCRNQAVQANIYCARHMVISQMITDGTLSPADLSFEIIAQPR